MRDKINSGHASDYEIGQYFRSLAGEYGATSGRPRRCGWFDLAWLHYCIQVNKPHAIALTKLDCLRGLKQLKVAKAYTLDGELLLPGDIPSLSCDFARVKPVYETLSGWDEDITGETDYRKLPFNARMYVEYIESQGGCPVGFIGTGPERSHIIRR